MRIRYLLPLVLMGQTAPPPTAAEDNEIVVTARKMSNRWAGRVSTLDGQSSCVTTKSTGDPEFDTVGCNSLLKCWPEYFPKIEAALKVEVAAGRVKTSEEMQRVLLREPVRGLFGKVGKCSRPLIFKGVRAILKQRKLAR